MTKIEAERIDIAWCDPGQVSGYFAASLAATVRDIEYHGAMGRIYREQGSLLTRSRNRCVERFLENDAEWLWMVDADMIFDKGHPMKLWETASEYGVKMVSGLAFIFKDGEQPVPSIFYPNPSDPGKIGLLPGFIPSGPSKVLATGLASSLVHRDVFEAMDAPRWDKHRWFDLIPIMEADGLAGEDVQFFVRAGELGFDLMVNPDAETWHIKESALGRGQWERYWELRNIDLDEAAKQVEAGNVSYG